MIWFFCWCRQVATTSKDFCWSFCVDLMMLVSAHTFTMLNWSLGSSIINTWYAPVIGDKIALSDPASDTSPSGSSTWFVENVTLFTTTVRFATTNEVATYSNGSLARLRIINAKRSPKAILYVYVSFQVWWMNPTQWLKVMYIDWRHDCDYWYTGEVWIRCTLQKAQCVSVCNRKFCQGSSKRGMFFLLNFYITRVITSPLLTHIIMLSSLSVSSHLH